MCKPFFLFRARLGAVGIGEYEGCSLRDAPFFVLITFVAKPLFWSAFNFFMKHCLILLILSCCIFLLPKSSSAQSIPSTERDMYRHKISSYVEQTADSNKYSTRGVGNILLSFYQKFISRQISADCIFKPSCSRYSRGCINKYGLIVGILMSGDRLTRCNGFSARDIPEYKFKDDGYAYDLP